MLGHEDDPLRGLLARAIRCEGGRFEAATVAQDGWAPVSELISETLDDIGAHVDVGERVVTQVGGVSGVPVASAVRAEGGEVDLVSAVLADITPVPIAVVPIAPRRDEPVAATPDLGAALRSEAGEVDVLGGVFATLGIETSEIEAQPILPADLADVPLASAIRFEGGRVELANAVMAVLGEAELPLAAAVHQAAGDVDVTPAVAESLQQGMLPVALAVQQASGAVDVAREVMASLELGGELAVAEAVRDEAGSVDVWLPVSQLVSETWTSALLDHELVGAAHIAAAQRLMRDPEAAKDLTAFADIGRLLRTGIEAEIDDVNLWSAVAHGIGLADAEEVPGYAADDVAAAVREEAEEIDIAAIVMRTLDRSALTSEPDVMEPANNGRFPVEMLWVAAAALLFTLVGLSVIDVAGPAVEGSTPMQYASAGEITIENLEYFEGQGQEWYVDDDEDGEGVMMIWVDEEAYL
jgi:hypothetical protein